MTVASAIADLTTAHTDLLGVFTTQKDTVSALISDAVIVSENASQIPLAVVATNLITMQALLVTVINEHT